MVWLVLLQLNCRIVVLSFHLKHISILQIMYRRGSLTGLVVAFLLLVKGNP